MQYILHQFNDARGDQLGKTNNKPRQNWTELKEKSPFTIKKGSAELMLFVTKFQTTWSNLSMKREAQFSIFIYNVKKQSQKYCVKFFALNCPRRFVLELHNFFWWCFILDYHY